MKRARDGHGLFINNRIQFKREHLLDSFLQFAQKINVENFSLDWSLPIESQDWIWAREQLHEKKHWLAINPAASKKERCWSIERYVAVIEEAYKRWSIGMVLTGGTAQFELDFAQAIMAKTSVPILNLVGQTTLKQLAAVLGSVKVLLAPDTGPLHIANAMNTPVIGLYAVAPPELSGPYRFQHLVINRFPDAVRQFFKKDPETVAWGTRVHDSRAMDLIQVSDVMIKLEEVF